MIVLHLTLKKKWFDMILSGEKKEEYREIKEYWLKRLCFDIQAEYPYDIETILLSLSEVNKRNDLSFKFKNYSHVMFKNGYDRTSPYMLIELNKISIGLAKPEWSENAKGYFFVLDLGKIIEHSPF